MIFGSSCGVRSSGTRKALHLARMCEAVSDSILHRRSQGCTLTTLGSGVVLYYNCYGTLQ